MKPLLANVIFLLAFAFATTAGESVQPPATTALTRAIRTEDFPAAKANITRGLVNQPDLGGYHPLTYATYTRNQQLIKALLDGGADPNIIEHDGTNALSLAAQLSLPEVIKTLHLAGATYPTAKNTRQPAAYAIRADAVESLKVLLQLYPQLDINAGWPWMGDDVKLSEDSEYDADLVNPHFSRSGLIFATVSGYDEMARLLLSSRADPSKRASSGLNALHYAAQNHRISAETLASLIGSGLSPLDRLRRAHYQPSTPLEFAVEAGSMGKVKVLAAGLDARGQSEELRRAALIGAAHGHDEIAGFLFRKIGEQTQTLSRYIRDHPEPSTNCAGTDAPAPTVDIRTTMPSTHPNAGKAARRPGTIAVIASPALRNHAAMVTQALSGVDGMTVVERDEIDHIAAEKLLGQIGGVHSSGQLPDLALIPAAQLVILEDLRISDRQFVKATLISTGSRIEEQRMVMEYADPDEAWVKSRLGLLLETVHRVKDRGDSTVALSLIPLTPASPSPKCLELTRYANLLLPISAAQQPGSVLLNLQQMRHLDAENAISGKGAYWKAGWVIEGSLALNTPRVARLVLAATPTGQGERVEVAMESSPDQISDSVNRAWDELAAKLRLVDETRAAPRRKSGVANGEAKVLASQARWFVDAGYAEDAYDIASASFLLGDRSEELIRAMTESAIDRLPTLKSRFCDHAGWDPRVLDPAVRFRMAAAIPDYLTLCDSARLYVARIDKPLVVGTRATESSMGRSGSYNEVVSKALGELHFFRQMLNDGIIRKEYQNEIRNLDQEIGSLTVEFMAKFKGHESEPSTLVPLLFEDRGYYSAHNPELLGLMLGRWVELLHSDSQHTVDFAFRRFFEWLAAHPGECLPGSRYAAAIEELRQSPEKIQLLRAVSAPTTADRVASMRKFPELAARTGVDFAFYNFKNLEWDRFLGMKSSEFISMFGKGRLHGGVGSLILNPPENFEKTAEFTRIADWYISMLQWSRMEPDRLEKLVTKSADRIALYPEAKRATSEADIDAFRKMMESIGRLTPAIGKVLNQMAPPRESEREFPPAGDAGLALKPLLCLPESPGQSQFARWPQATLDGDEFWLPVTYFEQPDYLWRSPYFETLPRNAIHVVRLTDRVVRTVKLPNDFSKEGSLGLFRPAQRFGITDDPSVLRNVILGSKHAYFLTANLPGCLYAIDRETLEVKRVNLPLPNVIAMSAIARGDKIYVSVSQEWDKGTFKGPKGATAVVEVEGTEITETVVSNQRKPSQRPLDDPRTWVDLIDVSETNMVLISNKKMSYMDPESYQGAVRGWGGGAWEKLPKQKLDRTRKQASENFANRFMNHRQVSLGKSRAYFTEDAMRGGIPAALVLVNNPLSQLKFQAGWLGQPSKAGEIKLVPISARPLTGEAQMDRQMYVVDEKERAALSGHKTRSANQIIEAAKYDASVCVKWGDEFLVFLTYRNVAMPAIWAVPEMEMQKAASVQPTD